MQVLHPSILPPVPFHIHECCFGPWASYLTCALALFPQGTSSRRLREGLLDNVDPAAPAEAADSGWRPVAVPLPADNDNDAAPSANSNGSGAPGARPGAPSGWPDQVPQEGPTTSGRPGAALREGTSSNGAHTSSSGGSNGARPADIGGWGVGANPLPDDWGWPPSKAGGGSGSGTWAGLSGAGRRNGNGAAPGASARGAGDDEEDRSLPEQAWEESAEEVQWGAEEGPDIVELRPQEVVRLPSEHDIVVLGPWQGVASGCPCRLHGKAAV